MAVDFADIESLHPRHGEQLVAQIDAEDMGAQRLDLGGQRAVAAAEIENALAGLGAEHAEYRTGKLLHEAAVLGIVGGRPALHRLGRRACLRPCASLGLPRLVIQRRLHGARAKRRAGRTIGFVSAGEVRPMRLLPGPRRVALLGSAAHRRCDAARHATPAGFVTARRDRGRSPSGARRLVRDSRCCRGRPRPRARPFRQVYRRVPMVLPVHQAKSSVKIPICVFDACCCAGTMASRARGCPGRRLVRRDPCLFGDIEGGSGVLVARQGGSPRAGSVGT